MKKSWKIAGAATGVALMVTAILGTSVFADDGDDTTTAVTCPAYDGTGGGGYGRMGVNGLGDTTMDTVSGLVGLTAEEIQALRYEGNSLADIAEANGISEDALVAAIMAEKTVEIQARVTEGTLTQEQADYMIQNMEQRTIQMVTRTTTGPAEWSGANGAGGFGGCGGGFYNGTTSQAQSRIGGGMMGRSGGFGGAGRMGGVSY